MIPSNATVAEQLARRLLLMTLALEESLARECWHEVDDLFCRRSKLIDRLEECDLDEAALDVITTVKALDDRIAANLQKGKSLISDRLLTNKTGRKAVKAYAQSGSISNLDQAG